MYAPAQPGSMTCWCSLHPCSIPHRNLPHRLGIVMSPSRTVHPCSIPRRNLPHRLGIVDVPFPHSSISPLLFGAPGPV